MVKETDLHRAPSRASYQLLDADKKIQHMVAFLHNVPLDKVQVEMYHEAQNGFVILIQITHVNYPIEKEFQGQEISTVEEEFETYFGTLMISHFKAEFDAVEDFVNRLVVLILT